MSSSTPSSSKEDEEQTKDDKNKKVLHILIIAHPDDESMFFIPTIRTLIESNQIVWILCLTNGNYDGLGKIRERELIKVGKLLDIDAVIFPNSTRATTTAAASAASANSPIEQNDSVDDTYEIKDHPKERWNIPYVSSIIKQTIISELLSNRQRQVSDFEKIVILTFDEYGISGHVNHTDTYLSVCHCLNDLSSFDGNTKFVIPQFMKKQEEEETTDGIKPSISSSLSNNNEKSTTTTSTTTTTTTIPVEAWELESERNLIYKYIPLVSWIYFLISILFGTALFENKLSTLEQDGSSSIMMKRSKMKLQRFRYHQPWINWYAMTTHQSQFVWYRRLFVVFSLYTYVNKLKRIDINSSTSTSTSSSTTTTSSSTIKKNDDNKNI